MVTSIFLVLGQKSVLPILVTSVFLEHQDAVSRYDDFIRNFDTRCQRSIVRIRYHLDDGIDTMRTGVVVASTNKSCWVITSNDVSKNNEVEFFDGKRAASNPNRVRIRNGFKMAIIPIIGLDGIHWEVATFSQNEAILGQTVFTLGYNTDNQTNSNQTKEDGTAVTGNFISGSQVSRAGIRNDKFKDIISFVHGCATGVNGHRGSGVFSDTEKLVGVNFLYTTTKGVDYESDRPDGGLVSALDLQTIRKGLEALFPVQRVEDKSLPEIVQFLGEFLTYIESKEATGQA